MIIIIWNDNIKALEGHEKHEKIKELRFMNLVEKWIVIFEISYKILPFTLLNNNPIIEFNFYQTY